MRFRGEKKTTFESGGISVGGMESISAITAIVTPWTLVPFRLLALIDVQTEIRFHSLLYTRKPVWMNKHSSSRTDMFDQLMVDAWTDLIPQLEA
jgi:hypothetical protein